jgi:glycosyltransferase involved in cell wall biosynthesis
MEVLLWIIAIGTCLGLLISAVELILGFSLIKNLKNQKKIPDKDLPSISIIFSALNEEKDIEAALNSLFQLNYPNLEIIAINDRSTDDTPVILDRLKQNQPRLRVFHIDELPEGWLGKNHALNFASKHARGDWILFTDADVLMKPDTLRLVMSYVAEKKLDHLTIFEHHIRKTFWLRVLLLGHYITYSIVMNPWRIRYAWSKKSLGHGAFNLVSKKVYMSCGGHRSIAMECMDDLKLGEMIKKNGYRQDTVDGRDFIEKEWYKSLGDMIEGVKKNSFSYFKYRPLGTLLVILGAFTFFVWPFFGMFLPGTVGLINALNVALTLFISIFVARKFRLNLIYALFYPFGICILLYTVLNSLISTYKNKGVIWRGTFYPIKKLKKV